MFNRENVHLEIRSIQLLGRILTNIFIIDENIEKLKNDPEYRRILQSLTLFVDRLSLIPEIKEIQVEVNLFTGMMPTQQRTSIIKLIVNIKQDTETLNTALSLLSHQDLHVSMKAASVLSHMTMQYYKRDFLKSKGVIVELIKLLNHNI